MAGLDAGQLERYARQVVLEEVGPRGQAALGDAAVCCVGAGGLGSAVVPYLAAAGVGRLGIVDDDVVERSNLGRQVIHGEADLGRPKVESAAEFVAALNSDVTVDSHECRLEAGNVADLVADYDVVVDGSDNFPTRFLLNDACVLAGVPLVTGAVLRFEGQVAAFAGGRPCYRCLFPEAPPPGTVPDCATAGVLGAVPGTVGTLQATAVLKRVLDVGESLDGRLLVYDALALDFEAVSVEPDPDCPVCGESPLIESVTDVRYEGRCVPSQQG